jgi:ubiquitin carboxyl-terminal hydrolase 10
VEKEKLDKSRDKESADVITNAEVVKAEVKSKSASSVSMSNNSRSVSVTNNSAAYPPPVQGKTKEGEKGEECREAEAAASSEFPQLAKMPNGTVINVAPKGRSWASIASSKTASSTLPLSNAQLPPPSSSSSGAPLTHNSDNLHCQADQSLFPAVESKALATNESSLNLSSSTSSSSHVPIIHEEKQSLSIDAPPIDSSSLTDENDPIALRLGEFLATYTLDHHSLALSPRGLCNQSNFCYINATLQALLACPPFVNLFRSLRDILSKKPCKATPIIQSVFDFVSEFEPMLRGNNSKRERRNDAFCTGSNLEPTGIRKVLGLLEGSTFKVEGRQEDAEEFLSHLLNALHDEMIKVMKWAENRKERLSMKNTISINQVNVTQLNGRLEDVNGEEDDEDQWQVMGPRNKGCLTRKTAISKSPISETFLGQMCSALHRMNPTSTNFKSATLQPFYTLQLDIQNENIRSVRDALEGLSAKEELTGIVSNNGVEMEAWRQISLEDLPMVLILHLKRFVFEKSGNKIQKVDKKLDFGIDLEIGKDLLSVSSKTKYTMKQRQYKLFAVVYHDGEEAHKGHYVADCFHPSGGSMWGQCGWLRFDDTAVKQIPENQMLTSLPPRVPYLLYYRRADTLLSHATPNQQQQPKKERM